MSYEELKKRVAMLKEVEKQDVRLRKDVAVKEAAEVAKAKAELLAREKENDARLTSARKAVDQATERSQRMRTHYEEQLRKMQSKLDQTHGRLEAVKEKAAAEATAAEERHRDAMAEVQARANHAAAQREERLTEQVALLRQELDAAKSRALHRTKEVVASEEEWRFRAETAEAAAGVAQLERDAAVNEMEALKRTFAAREAAANEASAAAARTRRAEVDEAAAEAAAAARAAEEEAVAAAVVAAAAASDARCASLRDEHKATLAAIDERVRRTLVRAWNPSGTREVGGSTVALLRGESAKLKAQLMASMEKEAALSRVLKDQAAELLGGVTTYPQ